MIILVKLILAHLIGDFILQPGTWVKAKETNKVRAPQLYWHVFIHGVLVLLFLWNLHDWPLAVAVMVIHYGIDVLKLYLQKEKNRSAWFWIDQVLHIAALLVLYCIWFQPGWRLLPILDKEAFWLLLTALVFITIVAGVMMKVLLRQWAKEIDDKADQSLKKAGMIIGVLERLFIFLFVMSGHWEAIGFLLAAKSIFRFGDLKEARDRKLTEYILIGTLFSFGIAIAAGMFTRFLLSY